MRQKRSVVGDGEGQRPITERQNDEVDDETSKRQPLSCAGDSRRAVVARLQLCFFGSLKRRNAITRRHASQCLRRLALC
jgi:hypothetical protein